MIYEATNWNKPNDKITKAFWDQNVRQFWVDEEIPISGDKKCWETLTPIQQDIYTKALAGLTLLDTNQATIGIPYISEWIPDTQIKAVLSFMEMMEHMHAKSYSSIFTTLCTTEQIQDLFSWVDTDPIMREKLSLVVQCYRAVLLRPEFCVALAASVFLESFLFYTGFFYPLYLAGQGLMIHSCEIINLIIRDESIHGLYIGQLFQKTIAKLTESKRRYVEAKIYNLLDKLMELEDKYSDKLYSPLGLQDQVKIFSRYNADKALQNLQLKTKYNININTVNPIVLNGLKTTTKNHDFFSTKGNGYIKPTNVEQLKDSDFDEFK